MSFIESIWQLKDLEKLVEKRPKEEPLKEKPLKEKPLKEKPLKEKPLKEEPLKEKLLEEKLEKLLERQKRSLPSEERKPLNQKLLI